MQFFLTAVLFAIFSVVSFAYAEVPEGFKEYKVRKGDAFSKIAPREHWDLIEKINRIDEFHLPVGKKILIPCDFKKANDFLPMPRNIPETSADKLLLVLLDIQYFGAYENGELKFWGPISSGKEKKPTPPGNYEVLWKSKKYFSQKYNRAPMSYSINFSGDGLFLHQQDLPDHPASHGCVRLRMSDAELIFNWLEKGDLIIIPDQGTKGALSFCVNFILST